MKVYKFKPNINASINNLKLHKIITNIYKKLISNGCLINNTNKCKRKRRKKFNHKFYHEYIFDLHLKLKYF